MSVSKFCYDDITVESIPFDLMDSRTYVITAALRNDVDGNGNLGSAIVIDPTDEKDIVSVLKNRGIKHVSVILTHEHFDHVCGVTELRNEFETEVIASSKCAELISAKRNSSFRFPFLFIGNRPKYNLVRERFDFPYIITADKEIESDKSIRWEGNELQFILSPGHSAGGMSLLINKRYLFAGDTLLGTGEELKSVDADKELFLKTLDKFRMYTGRDIIVFPGHGEAKAFDELFETVISNGIRG